MKKNLTVHKIGGTSMLQYSAVRDNIINLNKDSGQVYDRVFVVSAYAGITNHLLSDKKSGEAGVFSLFQTEPEGVGWQFCLDNVLLSMLDLNAQLFGDRQALKAQADSFISARVNQVKEKLITVGGLLQTGFFTPESAIPQCGEMLAGLGEVQSAWNLSQLIGSDLGYATHFLDLTGWEQDYVDRDQMIKAAFASIDVNKCIPIVTGYSRSKGGVLGLYGRGYTEMTLSDLSVRLEAQEAVIHKEFHLSTADPRIVGEEKARTMGVTDYDIADQLSHYGMEAIHPEAAQGMRKAGIPIRIKNTFEPEHPGTLISFSSNNLAEVEIIASRDDVVNINCFDHGMLGALPEAKNFIQDLIFSLGGEYVSSTHSANSIGVVAILPLQKQVILAKELDLNWPDGDCELESVAQVGVLGRDMDTGKILRDGIDALIKGDVCVMAASTGHRDIEVRFIVPSKQHDVAVKQLHAALVEKDEIKVRRKVA